MKALLFILTTLLFLTLAIDSVFARGFLFSLDGIKPNYLSTLIEEGALPQSSPTVKIHQTGFRALQAESIVTTLTSTSHVSIITCSTPGQHGVIANRFLVGGETVIGFSAPIQNETFWQAVRRQGGKVLSLGYVATDGSTPERSVDAGLAYPSSKLIAKSQTILWKWNELSEATDWKYGFLTWVRLLQAKEAKASITLNPLSGESIDLNLLVVRSSEGKHLVFIDTDKDLSNGYLSWKLQNEYGNMIFTEKSEKSDLVGRKRRVFFRLFNSKEQIGLFLSAPGYNKAHPESFRQWLDDNNLVWVTSEDKTLLKNGHITPSDYVDQNNLQGILFANIAKKILKTDNFDLVLFYQPILDSIGHAFEGLLPKPFTSENTDAVTMAYVRAFQKSIKNIDEVLKLTTKKDAVMILGDHGMTKVHSTINVAAFAKAGHDQIDVVTNGGSAMIYSKSPNGIPQMWRLLGQLKRAERDGLKVVDQFRIRSREDWDFGEASAMIYAASGYAMSFKPDSKEAFLPPKYMGAHGHHSAMPDMATLMMLKGPKTKTEVVDHISLIQAIPMLAEQMEINPPKQCVGE
jgi:predicted AlkP superfamily pyrophosphatase or phosphodiesterase